MRRFFAYSFLPLVYVLEVLPIVYRLQIPDTRYNWTGKAVAALFAILVSVGCRLTAEDIGLRKPKVNGWLLVGLIPIALTLLGRFLLGASLRSGPEAIGFTIANPVLEELCYRGIAFALICQIANGKRSAENIAIVGTAFIFGLVHMISISPEGLIFLPGNADMIVWGLALGYLRARTDSILPGIVSHVVANAVLLNL
jgi:membrane protease YdiL (CAAX protease family)